MNRRASDLEVEDGPPYWPRIMATISVAMCCARGRSSALGCLSGDLPRTASPRPPSSLPPPWWRRKGRSRSDPSRSWEKPSSFIEGGEEAPPPSASGSVHRSAAESSHTTSSHREQLGLRRGQAPKGIAPFSTGVIQRRLLDLLLQLLLATPAPIPDQLRPAIPAEEALERPGPERRTLKPCSWLRGERGENRASWSCPCTLFHSIKLVCSQAGSYGHMLVFFACTPV